MIHAELGASSAERWMNCPGSVAMVRDIPETTTSYAIEGTVAHKLAEMARSRNVPPDTWVGVELDGVEVTEEMAQAVEVFNNEITRQQASDPKAVVLSEYQFDLSPLDPPAPMFGTSDAAVFQPTRRRLTINDFKYGVGVVVAAEDNPQLQYYGLGALLKFEREHGPGLIDDIELVIVQPRASHPDGIVRRWVITYEDLVAFSIELLDLARRTLEPEAPLNPGKWCRFCRAAGRCPALKARAQAVALVEFDDLPADLPPAPSSLPVEVLADVLDKADLLEDWLASVRQHATAMLERGETVPGWKLVPKRATRRWISEAQVITYAADHGYSHEEISDRKLKSPAQLEKLFAKVDGHVPEDLYEKKSSGVTLAPDADPRPVALIGPAHDFADEPLELGTTVKQ